MNNLYLFTARRLPGRVASQQAAALLGFSVFDIPVLIKRKLLRPLGKPMPNAPKLFASVEILKLMEDEQWLSKSTQALSQYWKEKNLRKMSSSAKCKEANVEL